MAVVGLKKHGLLGGPAFGGVIPNVQRDAQRAGQKSTDKAAFLLRLKTSCARLADLASLPC